LLKIPAGLPLAGKTFVVVYKKTGGNTQEITQDIQEGKSSPGHKHLGEFKDHRRNKYAEKKGEGSFFSRYHEQEENGEEEIVATMLHHIKPPGIFNAEDVFQMKVWHSGNNGREQAGEHDHPAPSFPVLGPVNHFAGSFVNINLPHSSQEQ